MYRRLLVKILAAAVAFGLCAGEVYAAETGNAVEAVQNADSAVAADGEKGEPQTAASRITGTQTETETAAITENVTETETETAPIAEAGAEAAEGTETETVTKVGTAIEISAETDTAADTEAVTETGTDPETETETAAITETGTGPETETETATETETVTEDRTETEPEVLTETETATETETVTEDGTETEPEVLTDTETVAEEDLTEADKRSVLSAGQSDEEEEAVEEGDPDFLFQAGGFQVLNAQEISPCFYSARSAEQDTDALAKKIYEGLKANKERIDIVEYGLQYSSEDRKLLLNAYYAVVNDHPELYYVRTSYSIVFNSRTNIITAIKPKYYTDMDKAAFAEAVEKAKSAVTEDMDDMQKAIAIHEYLVLTCEYDKERLESDKGCVPKESYGAYGALVSHIAVCQGYALAFKYLMSECGIEECYIVTSDTSNHAWNMIQLNGEYYQFDATWDDPTWDKYGLVSHKYLFVSDAKLAKDSGHKDWYVTKGSGIVTDINATDTTYDDYFWTGVKSPLAYDSSSRSYYFVDTDKNIVKKNYENGSFGNNTETVRGNIGTTSSGLALSGRKLYFNTPTEIRRLDLDSSDADNGETVRFALQDPSEQIYGFTRFGNVLRYVKEFAEKTTVYVLDDSKEEAPAEPVVNDKKYTVTFQDKFGTVFAVQEVAEGAYAVPPKTITPQPGYTFSEWSGNYSNVKKDETVLAVYAKISYSISYRLDGGTNNKDNPAKYDVETADIVLQAPAKAGVGFIGWYADSGFTQPVTVIPKGSYGNLIFYAKWKSAEQLFFTVTFVDSTGETLAEVKVEEGSDATPPAGNVPEGYVRGWEGNYKKVLRDETVKAVYAPQNYSITYVLDGGKNSAGNPASYTVETDSFSLEEPAHPLDYMAFRGWYLDSGFRQAISAVPKGSTGNLTVYAKWEDTRGFWAEGVEDCVYTGKAVTADQVRVYYGDGLLVPGADYTVSYKNNVNVASASSKKPPSLVITARGNYEGQLIKTFSILPVPMEDGSVSAQKMAVAYRKGKTQKPVPVVTWNGTKLTKDKDYTVSYTGNPVNPGTYTVKVTGRGNFSGSTQTELVITDNKELIAMNSVKISKKYPDRTIPQAACGSAKI